MLMNELTTGYDDVEEAIAERGTYRTTFFLVITEEELIWVTSGLRRTPMTATAMW